jgi:hypothetical protein
MIPSNRYVFTLKLPLAVLVLCVAGFGTAQAAKDVRNATVGFSAQIEQIVLPGSELNARPQTKDSPIVLRIVDRFPHGSNFRYDLEYYGLESGSWNLSDFLQRSDGTQTEGLPEIRVEIAAVLPPGQVEPNMLKYDPVRGLGGYRNLMAVSAVAWTIGLVLLLFAGRKKSSNATSSEKVAVSVADRLRPMVSRAIDGELSEHELAELELTLVMFWRRRLNLDQHDAASIIPTLRQHDEAGPLLTQLEVWLHQPGGAGDVNITALLEPYRDLPEDSLETPGASFL